MTCKRWTTDIQEEWLKARIAVFLKAHQKKLLSKDFFPVVVKEFRDQWPVPPLTAVETAAETTAEQAMKVKSQKYDQVWSVFFWLCACVWHLTDPMYDAADKELVS